MSDYAELLSKLAAQRERLNATHKAKAKLLEDLEVTEAYQSIIVDARDALSQIDELEKVLRFKALAAYSINGIKKPHPALGIRVTNKVVYDPKEAEAWSKENLPTAFTFDTKFFETYVKNVANVPCATIEQVPTATIATDLSEYLKEAK
jgi:hypothetical protein